MQLARRVLLGAWSGYALVWLALLTAVYWPWPPAEENLGLGILVMLGFGVGLVVSFLGLIVGVVIGWLALRQRVHRTWPNLLLVGTSIVGAVAQAMYASVFFFGAL